MARYRVLISAPYFQPVLDNFREQFEQHGVELLVPPVVERLTAAQLIPLVSDIDGVISGDDEFTEEVLANAPRLRVISKWGTGIDSIDQKACQRLGIAVCNTPDAFSDPVADSTLAYALLFLRQIHILSEEVHSGRWVKRSGRALSECTVGLIGLGNVGRAVARRLAACGARILGVDPQPPPLEFITRHSITLTSQDTLLRDSDIVSLHCDLNPTSYHLMRTDTLAMMKASAYLINTARGKLINEPELIAALRSERLAGAALDVFEEEPLPEGSPLRSMNNVFLAPHNSNSSPSAWLKVHRRTIEQLFDYLPDATR